MAEMNQIAELQFINYLIASNDIQSIYQNGINPTHFIIYKEEFMFIREHIEQYGMIPDDVSFLAKFPSFSLMDCNEDTGYLCKELKAEKVRRETALAIQHYQDQLVKAVMDESNIDYEHTFKDLLDDIRKSEGEFSSLAQGYDVTKMAIDRQEEYQRRQEHEGSLGVPFGIKTLDRVTGGMMPDDVTIVAGRPSTGKSFLALFFGISAQQAGFRVAYVSLEMSAEKVAYRYDTLRTKLSNRGLTQGLLTKEEQLEYAKYIESLYGDTPFTIYTSRDIGGRAWGINEVESLMIQRKADLIILDQLSLMGCSKKNKTERETFVEITRGLKRLTSRYNIPIILIVQANRDSEKGDNTPTMADLFGSDSIGQDADKLIGIARKKDVPNVMMLGLNKNRDGEDMIDIMCKWVLDRGIIEELNSTLEDYQESGGKKEEKTEEKTEELPQY